MGRPKREGGMGFRNFKDFNIALLAKQCWWLIHEPDSLWAQVLNESYFPNVSFLEAKKCGMAFWACASLLEGKDLILKIARWQILGGHDINSGLIIGSETYLVVTFPLPFIQTST